jgi:putative transposase
VPLRVHGILDDSSRYVVGLWATDNEREMTMIDLLMRSIRRRGVPKTLYLDNGATYRGDALALVCARLNIRLLHAKPYDPEARGKMERFWRTLREQCLQFVGSEKSHHDVQGDLQSYHPRPHSSLCGESPQKVWNRGRLRTITEEELSAALTMRRDTRVRCDGTVSHGGLFYEVPKTFLCSKKAVLVTSLADPKRIALEYEGICYALQRVDALRNAITPRRKSDERMAMSIKASGFDPNASRSASRNIDVDPADRSTRNAQGEQQ